MNKYRVRKGLFETCILQYLEKHPELSLMRWVDVTYQTAPRALVSEFDVYDKIKKLEIENAELFGEKK